MDSSAQKGRFNPSSYNLQQAFPGNGGKKPKVVLLTASISERALQIATNAGIEVILVNPV